MKKFIRYMISIGISVIIALFFCESVLQIIPLIYRNFPVADDKIYVYVLGESSAWGQPYQSKISYSKIIGYMTDNKLDGKDIDFKVFAYPGSLLSEQYKEYFLYKCLHPFQKGIILFYMGTNNWANKDSGAGYSFLLKFTAANFIGSYFNNTDNFKYEYERILLSAKKFGDDPYISTIAGNYAGFMPDNVSSLTRNLKLKEEITEIDDFIFHGFYKAAMEKCLELLKANEDKSQILYRIGKVYEKQGMVKNANEAYLHAVDFGWDARPAKYQNDVILSLAAKYDIPVTDTFKKLYDSNEIIGYDFFADKVHPSLRLNVIIAEGFAGLLSKKYNLTVVNGNLSDENILKMCDFTEDDSFFFCAEALREIFMYSYIDGIVCKYNFGVIEKYIRGMKETNAGSSDKKQYIYLCEKLLEYLKNHNAGVEEILTASENLKGKFSSRQLQFDIFYGWINRTIKKQG